MNKVVELNHRKGTLTLCNTEYINYALGDIYFYVEAYHFKPIDGVCYLDSLAPSLELYSFVSDALKNKKNIKQNSIIFKNMYKKQLKNHSAVRTLKRLEYYLQQGNNITLFCDARHLRFNHLIILGNLFKELDYIVNFKFTLSFMNLHNLLVENVTDYL
jgi:uncharacterized protein YeaO (DUF488 family)